MNWIELMGLSGVGKTTFLKAVIEYEGSGRNWVIQNEAFIDIAKNKSGKNYVQTILRLYLRQNLLHSSKVDLARILINNKRAYLKEAALFRPYLDSYLEYYYNQPVSPTEKAYRISLYRTIVENLCIWKEARFPKTVIMDEGLLNHHPNLFEVDFKKTRISPSGLVFCHLDAKEIFRRIKKREEQRGRPSPLHRNMSEAKLQKDIQIKLKRFGEKRAKLISEGIPYIDIDLDKLNPSTLKMASQFMNTLKTEIV